MRLRQIEVLHAIKIAGSLSGAADALSITQPAVSKILRQAEQQIGFPLFHRTRGRLYPTDQAEQLMSEIERVFEGLDRTLHLARNLRAGVDTHLRIACLPSLGMGVVPRAVQRFRQLRPRATIEIAARHDPELQTALLARDFDVAVGFGPSEGVAAMPGIRAQQVDIGRMVYIDHPTSASAEAKGAPIRLSQIDRKRLIGLISAHFLGTALRDALRAQEIAFVPAIQVQTYYIARMLVAAGSGCAVIDEFTADAPAADIVVRPVEPPLTFGVYVYSREQHPLSKRGLEFIDCLRAVCHDSHRWAQSAARAEPAGSPVR